MQIDIMKIKGLSHLRQQTPLDNACKHNADRKSQALPLLYDVVVFSYLENSDLISDSDLGLLG